LRLGRKDRRTTFMRFNQSTGSYFTPALFGLQEGLGSQDWKLCWQPVVRVLSVYGTLPEPSKMTCSGGPPCLAEDRSVAQSHAPSNWLTDMPTQMPAQGLALALSLGSSGGLGVSSRDGRRLMEKETLVGPRQWALNCLFGHSPGSGSTNPITKSLGITKASLRVGGTVGAATVQSTGCSNESRTTSPLWTPQKPCMSLMSTAPTIPQMAPPGVNIPPLSINSQSLSYQKNWLPFSSMPNVPSLTSNCNTTSEGYTQSARLSLLHPALQLTLPEETVPSPAQRKNTLHSAIPLVHPVSHFNKEFAISPSTQAKPRPYPAGLCPRPSVLRPHCLARDRLRIWRPNTDRAEGMGYAPLTDSDLTRMLNVMAEAWAPGTRETYGSGLLVFHVFCDSINTPESERCPVSTLTLLRFITACAGAYAGTTIANYIFAVKAWHTLHGGTWNIRMTEIQAALDGAARLAPNTSRRSKRLPWTPELIARIAAILNFADPLDAAAFACLTVVFWTMSRTAEFVTPNLSCFSPAEFISRGGVQEEVDRNGLRVLVFKLPKTKISRTGEDVYCARQDGPSDPIGALMRHFTVNHPPLTAPLFAWRHPDGLRPLTRAAFTSRMDVAINTLNVPKLHYHGLRIGSVLEYLLRGVPFEVVKTMGRWSSDSFTLYLRKHATVLAPYIQNTPILDTFTRITMPPVR